MSGAVIDGPGSEDDRRRLRQAIRQRASDHQAVEPPHDRRIALFVTGALEQHRMQDGARRSDPELRGDAERPRTVVVTDRPGERSLQCQGERHSLIVATIRRTCRRLPRHQRHRIAIDISDFKIRPCEQPAQRDRRMEGAANSARSSASDNAVVHENFNPRDARIGNESACERLRFNIELRLRLARLRVNHASLYRTKRENDRIARSQQSAKYRRPVARTIRSHLFTPHLMRASASTTSRCFMSHASSATTRRLGTPVLRHSHDFA